MTEKTILTPLDIFKVSQQHKDDPCAFARAAITKATGEQE